MFSEICCNYANINYVLSLNLISSDAAYTTQPLELLNTLSFENLRNYGGIDRNSEASAGDNFTVKSNDNEVVGGHLLDVSDNGKLSPRAYSNTNVDGVEDSVLQTNVDRSEGQFFKYIVTPCLCMLMFCWDN